MSNCDNNCEAVADLHDSAVNLIAYSNQIDKWVNGKQNETVSIGGVSTPTLRNLAMSIKQLVGVHPDNLTIKIDQNKKIYVVLKPGGGIKVDAGGAGLYIDSSDFIQLGGGLARDPATGAIYVDFDQMPTAKFDTILETFRKGLRLPKYLSSNLNIYVNVNHANAGDSLIEGRGLSPDLPFASIRAAVNFVAQNYSVGNYTLTIHVAAGTYGHFSCGEYARVNGQIVVQGEGNVFVNNSDNPLGSTIIIGGGLWSIKDLKIKNSRDRAAQTASTESVSAAVMVNGGRGVVDHCDIECEIKNDTPDGARVATVYGIVVGISGECTYFARAGTSLVQEVVNSTNDDNVAPFYTYGAFEFYATSDTSVSNTLTISNATYANFIVSNGGLVTVSAAWANQFKINATNCTGARYRVVNNGKINTNGKGPDFFPGTTAGYVEEATYSWYK